MINNSVRVETPSVRNTNICHCCWFWWYLGVPHTSENWACHWSPSSRKNDGSCSPQLWSFLDHKRFFHLCGGSSQAPAWLLSFPILLFKMFEKGKCCFVLFFHLSSLFWSQKGANSETELEQWNARFARLHMLWTQPQQNKDFFSSFLLGHTCFFPPSVPCTLVLIPCSLVAPSWSLSSSSLSHKSNNPACSNLLSASAVRVKPTLPRDSRLSTTPGLSGLWLAVLPRGQSKALF